MLVEGSIMDGTKIGAIVHIHDLRENYQCPVLSLTKHRTCLNTEPLFFGDKVFTNFDKTALFFFGLEDREFCALLVALPNALEFTKLLFIGEEEESMFSDDLADEFKISFFSFI